jgi:hypothetical protein
VVLPVLLQNLNEIFSQVVEQIPAHNAYTSKVIILQKSEVSSLYFESHGMPSMEDM